jgi:hypothetical protein
VEGQLPADWRSSPAFGAFKGVWEEWLVFEDAAGTLRSVDDSCEVRQTIMRQ